jgi:hypothetical protein
MPPPLQITSDAGSVAELVAQRGSTMGRALSFPFVAILTIGVASGAALRAQETARETGQETLQGSPPDTPQGTSRLTPPQPQPPPEFGDPRFVFHRVDNTYLRLDMRTGAVASCSQHAAGWACVLAPEERAAFDGEVARLQRENALLKNALLEHGVPLPDGMTAGAPSASPPAATTPPPLAESVPRPTQSVPPVAALPPASPPKSAESDHASRDDAEIERVMAIMEKVWRRVVEMMVNFQRDMQKKG